jgi:Zn-finger nucleic acid-binding protein
MPGVRTHMNCPQCDTEMSELARDDEKVHVCADCGQWVDGAHLNALLLHANLPGVDSLRGKIAPEEATGTCSTCGVSLVRVEHGQRGSELFHEVCEDCGSIYVPLDPPAAEDFAAACNRLVDFFRGLSAKKAAAARR